MFRPLESSAHSSLRPLDRKGHPQVEGPPPSPRAPGAAEQRTILFHVRLRPGGHYVHRREQGTLARFRSQGVSVATLPRALEGAGDELKVSTHEGTGLEVSRLSIYPRPTE